MKNSVVVRGSAKFCEWIGITMMIVTISHWFFDPELSIPFQRLFVGGFFMEMVGKILAWFYVGRRPLY